MRLGQPGRLPRTRPAHVHPIAWMHLRARAAIPPPCLVGLDDSIAVISARQAWLRRVSEVFDRMMREAGYDCEGA